MIERSIAVHTHGRYLIDPPASDGPAPLLVGFHGYGEGAEAQLERMRRVRVEEATAVGAELLDGFLARHRAHRERVLESLQTAQRNVWMEVLDHALLHEKQSEHE